MLEGFLCETAEQALEVAGPFLEEDPVANNVILTLLNERSRDRMPMRAWVIRDHAEVLGVAFRSPLDFDVNLVAMADDAVVAMARFMAVSGTTVSAVRGPAATAARFASVWLDLTDIGARPVEATRIMEATDPPRIWTAPGHLRQALMEDRDIVVKMMTGFLNEIHETIGLREMVERRLSAGQYWLWCTEAGPVSLAGVSEPIHGVIRIQAAYTWPEWRGRSFASACVGSLTRNHLSAGRRCILYTDLDNPISNHVFTKLGYRAVGDGLRYQFLDTVPDGDR